MPDASSEGFPWRPAPGADWAEQAAALDARVRALAKHSAASEYDAVAIEARRLANRALNATQNLKLQNLARRMLIHSERFTGLRCLRVGVTSNRTLSYLLAPIRAAGLARGLLIEPVEIPYDGLRAAAFGGPSELGITPPLDAVAIVLDEGAFPPFGEVLDGRGTAAAMDRAREFLGMLTRFVRDKMESRALLATLPSAGSAVSSSELALSGSAARLLMQLNGLIIEGAFNREWIMWDLAALAARVGTDRWFDPVRFHEAKVPFRIELGALAADHFCRTLSALSGKSCRALVLDLDDTLWGGSIGDDGIAGIRLGENSAEGEAYLAFQRFVLNLRQRGVVLAVSSKNTDAVAREPFRKHPEMLLKEEHIAVFQANWEDKASNLHAIAEALNLGLESLAFVDNSAAEREWVRQQLPLVCVPEVGSDPAYFPSRIADSGLFDHFPLTDEDRLRAESYRTRASGLELKTRLGNYDEYLQSLKMIMTVSPFSAVDRERVAQLINKSNQFNLTTRRYGVSQLREFAENTREFLCWQIRLDDIFGPHGIIAVLIVRKLPHAWKIDTWLMSCRVLARGIEDTIMNALMAQARDAGIEAIVGEYRPTQRNELVASLYTRLGFESVSGDDAGQLYRGYPASHLPSKSFITIQQDQDLSRHSSRPSSASSSFMSSEK
jgi:FkbH-like protein